MAETVGLDFAWSKPDAASTKECGYSLVLGYLSNDPSKNITAAECRAYLDAGLAVGLVWETGANRVLSGTAGGTVDGALAEQQANDLGYPVDCVIFFAVDYAEPTADFPVAAEYASAFNAKTRRPVGVYGDFAVIEHFVTPNQQPVQWGWQTVAWSSGLLSAKAAIYQRNTHHYPIPAGTTAGGCDEDVLCIASVPLWRSGVPTPPPAPAPAPAPAPGPAPAPWESIPDMQYGDTGANVLHLQQFLVRNYPLYNRYTPNGIYGPATAAGIHQFQARSGINSGDGMNVGPQTKQALWNAGYRP